MPPVPLSYLSATSNLKLTIMGQLHELLAVHDDRRNKARALTEETHHVFTKQRHLFVGFNKWVTAYDESRAAELAAPEEKKITTTVPDRLAYMFNQGIRPLLEVAEAIDRTNCNAKADLIVDGKIIGKDLPAVTLLSLGKEIERWLNVFKEAPTLDSGTAWTKAENEGKHVYQATLPVRKRSEKKTNHQVIVPATDRHPAQVSQTVQDVAIADINEISFCGNLSSADKAELLDRTEKLLAAVKVARQRANGVTAVPTSQTMENVCDFILNGKLPA